MARLLPLLFLFGVPGALAAQQGLSERQPGLLVVDSDEHDKDLRMTPVVRAVQKAADSVVSIYLNVNQGAPNSRGGRQDKTEGQGSGVILDDTGFVITNWHVVAAALGDDRYVVQVRLKDGRQKQARVLSSSPNHDLALLQLALDPG